MWEYVIVAIIGIIIYQIILFAVALCSNKEDRLFKILAIFVPYLIFEKIIHPIYEKTHLGWCRKNLNYYRFCSLDKDGKIHVDIYGFYTTKEMADTLEQDEGQPYFVKFISDCKLNKSAPYKDEIYNGQEFVRNHDMKKYRIN